MHRRADNSCADS
uniref:Uncharacterized protein n=1 Tax=Arundo donax TaxID=35708 RepID=A0A0A9HKH7_ARUDO